MSYFTDSANQSTETTDNQQTTPQANQAEDYVAKIVNAKGANWADPQVLAKGKLESDEFISNLEKQNEELRAELGKQDYASELLKQLQTKNETPTAGSMVGDNGSTEQENTTPQFSEDELKALVVSTLEATNADAVRKNNIDVVNSKLTEMYGTEVDKVMDKRSVELGMTKDRLKELAAESPVAFMQLVGGEAPKQEANPVTKGTINTSVDSFTMQSGERNWNYYQELRRKDRRAYFSPAVQKQMMQDKMRLGDKFGNN